MKKLKLVIILISLIGVFLQSCAINELHLHKRYLETQKYTLQNGGESEYDLPTIERYLSFINNKLDSDFTSKKCPPPPDPCIDNGVVGPICFHSFRKLAILPESLEGFQILADGMEYPNLYKAKGIISKCQTLSVYKMNFPKNPVKIYRVSKFFEPAGGIVSYDFSVHPEKN